MLWSTSNLRRAGLLYLCLGFAAPLRLIYIPTQLFVPGNAGATAANIAAREGLFRLGIAADLLCGALVIGVTLAFYRLFKEVDPHLSRMVVVLGGVLPGAIYSFNVLNDLAVLLLVRGPEFLAVFDRPQREALAMLFLRLHGQEILAAEVFWGLWLFPLAALIHKARLLPRFLVVWLVLNGLAYLAQSLVGVLWPHLADRVALFSFPLQLGEVALMAGLLIVGFRSPRGQAPAA